MYTDSSHRFCIAPMLDWTDRHCRYFHRLISHHAFLYTEMLTTGALIHGDREGFLAFDPCEKPVALQLGGSNPSDLAVCAEMAEDYGYDEVNLNVGCPSDRVQNGRFGACLMAEPDLVADCVKAMTRAISVPVTVKCRIGIDERDSYEELSDFIERVADSGCRTFVVHARKAWLSGLSPKQNREIPPLRYDTVVRLKQDFPHLEIILNGGIVSIEQAIELNNVVDGIMVGREAYHNPFFMAAVDAEIFNDRHPVPTRQDIVTAMLPYIREQMALGVRLHSITRHMLGLFHGVNGAGNWRRYLSENVHRSDADENVVIGALDFACH
ncbi:MAG: tRNA dihydrouridine(20/20a) synthase DusA [Gammaproteobacteria bacterium]